MKSIVQKNYFLIILILFFNLTVGNISVLAQKASNNLKKEYEKTKPQFPDRLSITLQYARTLFFENKIDEAFKIIDDNLKIAEKNKDGKYAIYLYGMKALNFKILEEIEESNKAYNKAKSYLTKTNDYEAKGYFYYCEGWLYSRSHQVSLAAESFLKSIKYLENTPNSSPTKLTRLSASYKELVAVYANLNEIDLQEKYSLLTIETALKQKDPEIIFNAYMTLGHLYENKLNEDKTNLKLRDLTEKYYLLAYNYYNSEKILQSNQSLLSFVTNNLANIYLTYFPKNYLDKAELFALKANEIAKKNNIYEHIATSSGILSDIALKKGNPTLAKEYLLNSIIELEKKPNPDEHIYLSIYYSLLEISENEGNLGEALKFSKLYNKTYQNIYDQEKLEITKRLEAQFEKELQQQKYFRLQLESEKKEQQIKLMHALDKQQKQDLDNLKLSEENQKRKLEIAELEAQEQEQALKLSRLESLKKSQNLRSYIKELKLKDKINTYYILVIVFISLFLVLLIYAFFQRLKRLKQKERLHLLQIEQEKQNAKISTLTALLRGQEEERSRLARDLHDGLGGLLSGTKIQLTNLNEKVDDSTKFNLNNSISHLDHAVDELRRVAHNLMPDLLLKYGLEQALTEYANRMTHENLDIAVQFLSFTNTMNKEEQLLVYRIIQELVNNSIKHAHPTEIIIQLVEDDTSYHVTVEDNGKGFDIVQKKLSQSAGIHNIQSRVEFLKGEIHFSSEKNLGTSVEFSFPKNNL